MQYLPDNFVYENYSIDEFIANYSDTMIFAGPMQTTHYDTYAHNTYAHNTYAHNTYTLDTPTLDTYAHTYEHNKYLKRKQQNRVYSANRRDKLRQKERELEEHCLTLEQENAQLREMIDMLSQRKELLESLNLQ
jgi:hypothetical protein